MSCYESEWGTIKIPTAAWPWFRQTMIKTWNARQDARYAIARAIYDDIMSGSEPKTAETARRAVDRYIDKQVNTWMFEFEDLMKLLRNEEKLKAPKQKDLDIKKISKGSTLVYRDFDIVLDDVKREVRWDVPEANRACDLAHEHPAWSALKSALDKMKWVRGTGGKILGNDEYNRDDHGEDGGGNYVKYRWGPLGNDDLPKRRR